MLLGFKVRFKEPILLGTKVFTMRNKRKVKPKIGETLHMYTGLRTSKCERISNTERLISTQGAWLKIVHVGYQLIHLKIEVDSRALSNDEINQFVKYDGFNDVYDFADYWIKSSYAPKKPLMNERSTIEGYLDLYHWTDLRY